MRRLVYSIFPGWLPSSRWRPEHWLAGTLATAVFELIVLALLVGIPVCIYFFKLRTGHTSARDLCMDCAAAASLYLAALLLL